MNPRYAEPKQVKKQMLDILKQTISDFQKDKCTRLAAALAYYTAFALSPTLVLLLGIAQVAFEPEDLRGRVRSEVESVVGTAGAEQIETLLESGNEKEEQGLLAMGISLAVMLLGATGLFAQLQTAMNDVWEVKPDPEKSGIKDFLSKRLLSFGMLLTIAFLFMVSITGSSLVHAFDDSIDRWLPGQSGSKLIMLVDYGITIVVLFLMFAAMFRFLPDAEINWSNVWVGALVTAVLFLGGKFAIAIYVANSSTANSFGAAGSLLVILIWVYYSAIIFLFGAEFTQTWAAQKGSPIVPEEGAVRVVTTIETEPSS